MFTVNDSPVPRKPSVSETRPPAARHRTIVPSAGRRTLILKPLLQQREQPQTRHECMAAHERRVLIFSKTSARTLIVSHGCACMHARSLQATEAGPPDPRRGARVVVQCAHHKAHALRLSHDAARTHERQQTPRNGQPKKHAGEGIGHRACTVLACAPPGSIGSRLPSKELTTWPCACWRRVRAGRGKGTVVPIVGGGWSSEV